MQTGRLSGQASLRLPRPSRDGETWAQAAHIRLGGLQAEARPGCGVSTLSWHQALQHDCRRAPRAHFEACDGPIAPSNDAIDPRARPIHPLFTVSLFLPANPVARRAQNFISRMHAKPIVDSAWGFSTLERTRPKTSTQCAKQRARRQPMRRSRATRFVVRPSVPESIRAQSDEVAASCMRGKQTMPPSRHPCHSCITQFGLRILPRQV